MQVLRDRPSIATVTDPQLRTLLQKRVDALRADFDDVELHELVTFVVMEPGDSARDLLPHLGFPISTNRSDGTPFGAPGFVPSFEVCEEHVGYYELVFVLSDDGFGVEVFIPKHPDIDPLLVAMCRDYALRVDP